MMRRCWILALPVLLAACGSDYRVMEPSFNFYRQDAPGPSGMRLWIPEQWRLDEPARPAPPPGG